MEVISTTTGNDSNSATAVVVEGGGGRPVGHCSEPLMEYPIIESVVFDSGEQEAIDSGEQEAIDSGEEEAIDSCPALREEIEELKAKIKLLEEAVL